MGLKQLIKVIHMNDKQIMRGSTVHEDDYSSCEVNVEACGNQALVTSMIEQWIQLTTFTAYQGPG